MQTLSVVAGILWRKDTFLVAKRPEGSAHEGFWEFPGGKIEPKETQSAALVREFQEEMNITPTSYTFWKKVQHTYTTVAVTLYFYHIMEWTGKLAPLEGHEIRWVSCEEAQSLPFLEADLPLITELQAATL